MYVPKHHEEFDLSVLHALVKAHPLGTWVTYGDAELIANHIPFLLDPTRGKHGTLVGHVARANRVWQSYSTTACRASPRKRGPPSVRLMGHGRGRDVEFIAPLPG